MNAEKNTTKVADRFQDLVGRNEGVRLRAVKVAASRLGGCGWETNGQLLMIHIGDEMKVKGIFLRRK